MSSVGLYPGLESATHIAPYTEPFDEVVLGKSQAITQLSERLKVDFALIDQNIANQILWLVSHAFSSVEIRDRVRRRCSEEGTARPTFELAQ